MADSNELNNEERLKDKDGNYQSIPVIQETLQVGKKVIETGKVIIDKKVIEEEVVVNLPVSSEELSVERIPLNKYVDTPPPPVRYEGETMIVSVLKEVVEKRLVLVEEVHVKKRKVEAKSSQTVKLKKEELHIRRSDNENKNEK